MTSPIQDYCLIPLTQGQFAKVSPHRYEELRKYKWQAWWSRTTKSFYAMRGEYTGTRVQHYKMHRQILGLTKGDGKIGDHWNHDTLDNRDSNLRVADKFQSARNRRRQKSNTTGYKGVYAERVASGKMRYVSYISLNGKIKKLKTHAYTPEGLIEGARQYDQAALKIHGEFAHLNFPTPRSVI